MKLLVCTQIVDENDPILGFFHRWVAEFAEHFERIDVICLKEGEHSLPAHVHVHSLGKEAGKGRLTYLFRFYRYFWRYYMRQDIDFVFYHMGAVYNILGAPFYFVRRLKKAKFLWWKTHGHINLFGRLALLFVDEVVTAAAESFPVSSKKRRVVGHAIDTERFAPKKNCVINCTINYTILFVGRVSRVKRIEQVLQVLHALRKKNTRYRARIVGPIADEAYHHELLKQTEELGLEESVEFLGGCAQSELLAIYHEAGVLMNPSDTDGLDKVALEAMACGVVPMTANHSFEALLSPYGLYTKKGDIDGYCEKIERVTGMGSNASKELRDALRREVTEHHALKTLPERIFHS